jgi:hypothetical protein
MRRGNHVSRMTMGPHRLGSIPGVLLRITVSIAPVLGPVCANAAEEQATVRATQEESPPKPERTATTSSKSVSSSSQSTTRSEQLEQVLVTGTYIRGVSPASPVITITSADIENSGASTAGEVLRQLPESFAGGQQSTIGTNGAGPYQNLANFNYSDSANLRGFGSSSNLVLINGHRVP